MDILKKILFSFFILTFCFSCSKRVNKEKITPFTIERCENCIYLWDYNDFEIKLGSTPIYFKKYEYYKPLIIEFYTGGKLDFGWNTQYHFYLRERDSLNTLVCYITEKNNENENIVECEIFKIFTEDTYLDKEGISYIPNGNYQTLKNCFKGLVAHLPDSLKQRPENYDEVNHTDKKRKDYFEQKDDMFSYSFYRNKAAVTECYTLTLNRETFDEDAAFRNNEKLYRLRDMAIYVAYFSDIPDNFFYRSGSEYFSLKNIEWFVDREEERMRMFGEGSYKSFYDSLPDKTKHKIDIIRKNRNEIPIQDFFDSIEVYKKRKKME